MAATSQTTVSNAFSWIKLHEFRLEFHLILSLRVQFGNIPALVQIMAWRWPGDKPLSEPMMVWLPMHICVTQPQWVNTNSDLPSMHQWARIISSIRLIGLRIEMQIYVLLWFYIQLNLNIGIAMMNVVFMTVIDYYPRNWCKEQELNF